MIPYTTHIELMLEEEYRSEHPEYHGFIHPLKFDKWIGDQGLFLYTDEIKFHNKSAEILFRLKYADHLI